MSQYSIRDWLPSNGYAQVKKVEEGEGENAEIKYYIDDDLLPAANFRFKAVFGGNIQCGIDKAIGVQGKFLVLVGDGGLIRGDEKNKEKYDWRFETEYYRFIVSAKFVHYGGPTGVSFIPFPSVAATLSTIRFTGSIRKSDIVVSVPYLYHVEYDPSLTREMQPPEASSFPRNRILGRVHPDYTMGEFDPETDLEIQGEDTDNVWISAARIPIPLIHNLTQGWVYEPAEYVPSSTGGGRFNIEFKEEEADKMFPIPTGAQIRITLLEQWIGFATVDSQVGIRVIKGGGKRFYYLKDSLSGESYSFGLDKNKDVSVYASKVDHETSFRKKILIYGFDPGFGQNPCVIESSSGKKLVIYEKTGRSPRKKPDDFEDKFVYGSKGSGLYIAPLNNIGDKDNPVRFNTEETDKFLRKEIKLVSDSKHHVVVHDPSTDTLWIFYWKPTRFKYPESKKKEEEEYRRKKKEEREKMEQSGQKIVYPYDKKQGDDNEELDYYYINRAIFEGEEELEEPPKDNQPGQPGPPGIPIWIGLPPPPPQQPPRKPKTVKVGSLFVKCQPLLASGIFYHNKDEDEEQQGQPKKRKLAEDLLVLPMPRDDTTKIPEQVVGVQMTSAGTFVLIWEDKDKRRNHWTIEVTDKWVKRIDAWREPSG